MFKRLGSFFLDLLEVVVLAFGFFLVIYLLILQPHKIDGRSMEPNFHNGEYLLTQRVEYKILKKLPQRGDVVVFTAPPPNQDKDYIKRIIGIPGDEISLSGGKYYINGNVLKETYIPSDVMTQGAYFLQEGQNYVVPTGKYFVSGDNRNNSSDSRYFGPIPFNDIKGKAWFRYWPLNQMGSIRTPSY
jgi:signal peptidase I